jgi:hypothetical protein
VSTTTYYYLCQNAIILCLDVHLRLVRLNLEKNISSRKRVACSCQHPYYSCSFMSLVCVLIARSLFVCDVLVVGSAVPSLIFQVAILPSVIVGERAGMLKFAAASEACAGWKAIWVSTSVSRCPICELLTSSCAIVAELLRRSARRHPTYRRD